MKGINWRKVSIETEVSTSVIFHSENPAWPITRKKKRISRSDNRISKCNGIILQGAVECARPGPYDAPGLYLNHLIRHAKID